MRTALAISPHLDDAVFSAGGTLVRLARDGWRVIIATVFTASVPDPRGFALACQLDKGLEADIDYMALRRKEDEVACALIGAEPRWLPFAEAPLRGYHSAPALFAEMHTDDAIVDIITPAILNLVGDVAPDLVFSPQAIGAHVDHVAVYMAVYAALRGWDRPHWLWADFPYVARPIARESPFADDVGQRLEHLKVLRPDEIVAKANAADAYASQTGFQFGGLGAADAIAKNGGIEAFATNDAAHSVDIP